MYKDKVIEISAIPAFGAAFVGSSPSKIFKISNKGGKPIKIEAISYPVGFYGDNWRGDLAVGQEISLNIYFSPKEKRYYGRLVKCVYPQYAHPLGNRTQMVSGIGI